MRRVGLLSPVLSSSQLGGAAAQRRLYAAAAVNHKKWDAIVVGGGHNGLVTAAYLAKVCFPTRELIDCPTLIIKPQ
jgi:hypothetical protein